MVSRSRTLSPNLCTSTSIRYDRHSGYFATVSQAVTVCDEHRKFPFNECVFAAAIITGRCLTESVIREVEKIRHEATVADNFAQRKLTSGKPSLEKYHFQIVPLRPTSGWSALEKETI